MFTKAYPKLKDLNFYAKIIGIILMILSIVLVKNIYLIAALILVNIIISLLLKNYKSLQMAVILIIIFMFYYLHPFLLILVKGLLLYCVYLIVKDLISVKEHKYLFDRLFYWIKSPKVKKMYISSSYKKILFNNNMAVYDQLSNLTRRKYSNYLVKQAEIKTNYDMQDVNYRNMLSYYGFSRKKRTNLNFKWDTLDNTFLLFSILIFILVVIYR